MASRFDSTFEARVLPAMFRAFGELAVISITPAGGSPTSYEACVGPETREIDEESGIRLIRFTRNVLIKEADLATVQSNATAAIGSIDDYHVVPIRLASGYWEIELTRVQVVEGARPGYRDRP